MANERNADTREVLLPAIRSRLLREDVPVVSPDVPPAIGIAEPARGPRRCANLGAVAHRFEWVGRALLVCHRQRSLGA